ncbi:MAG: EF-P lysine aminoacylase EpmA [Wenzhouxiangella sp.]
MSANSQPDWRPQPSLATMQARARLLASIRTFFAERNVLEVQTPLTTPHGITDPHIDSLALASGGFLRTSPEYAHKRLLAAGFGDLYELGPVFRAGEHGRRHRQQFTLLEWYRLGFDWRSLAEEVLELIRVCQPSRDWTVNWLAWRDSFAGLDGYDPLVDDERTLLALTPGLPEDCDRDMRLDYLLATEVQAHFPPDQLTVLYHYPASQAALARLDPDDPRLACRFEVFAGPLELANGYHELLDAEEQRRRFEQDNRYRQQLGKPAMPMDQTLLAALASGLPDCAGVALGVDRLLMALLDQPDIAQVCLFE